VVAYLRKEKDIVDLQLELSKQENVRLKVQIEHLAQNLQEIRVTLAQVCHLGVIIRDTLH
jgi:nucleoprotein TPR